MVLIFLLEEFVKFKGLVKVCWMGFLFDVKLLVMCFSDLYLLLIVFLFFIEGVFVFLLRVSNLWLIVFVVR